MTKDFDARNERKSRSVCAAMAESADTGKRVLTDRERQILDMWPRFEDSEPVWIGDEVVDFGEVVDIDFADEGVVIWNNACNHLHIAIGERVKRHVPEAMDADGVEIEVGDTVWTLDGLEGVVTKVEDGAAYIAYESDYAQREEAANLTHTRPDSWERLEEDAAKYPCDYAEVVNGSAFSYCEKCPWWEECGGDRKAELMALDIIRRAKKLAGVE